MYHHHSQSSVRSLPAQQLWPPLQLVPLWLLPLPPKLLILLQLKLYICLPLFTLLLLCLTQKKRKLEKELSAVLASVDKEISDCHEVDDEAAQFGRSIATKMRNFDRYTFALARRQIEILLFDLEFGATTWPLASGLTPQVSGLAPQASGFAPQPLDSSSSITETISSSLSVL